MLLHENGDERDPLELFFQGFEQEFDLQAVFINPGIGRC
jgi:hypothetical protein